MAIEETYRELMVDAFIKQQLATGNILTSDELEDFIKESLLPLNLKVPQFSALSFTEEEKSNASASRQNSALSSIKQDLRALYKELMVQALQAEDNIERWYVESGIIEKNLIDLESRIDDLLFLASDTEGYHSIIADNFTDSSMVDLSLTTASLNLDSKTIEMATVDNVPTRVLLNDLTLPEVLFRVRSTIDFVSRTDAPGTSILDPFKQTSAGWWTIINMKTPKPTTAELTVRIGRGENVLINKINLNLLQASEISEMQITPLYSTDNRQYNQLPSVTFTQTAKNLATFAFPAVEAQWFKFLLTKEGPDKTITGRGTNSGNYVYQFGFKSIYFYSEGFARDTVQEFISKPLRVLDNNLVPIEFSKISLETCERVEENTHIDYYVTFSDDIEVPVDDSTHWTPVNPINRTTLFEPGIISVSDTLETVIGDDEDLLVSFDVAGVDFTNPDKAFHLLSLDEDTEEIVDTEIDPLKLTDITRYVFSISNERILNYQLTTISDNEAENIDIDEKNILLFRNLGEQGLDSDITTSFVRGIERGWGFEDPYYYCVIEILNKEGMEIDVGSQPIIIDNKAYTGRINNTILTGKSATLSGIHSIKVHKDNWLSISPNLMSLEELKAADTLYPFNHKLLIEGYSYSEIYPLSDEKIYLGASLFAQYLMNQTNIIDFIGNVAVNRYDIFAMDQDIENSHYPDYDNLPTKVFVVRIDDTVPDFENERYMLRFLRKDNYKRYMRLKAVLSTEDENVAPSFSSYRIKVG